MHKNLGLNFARKVFFAVFSIKKRLTIKIVIDVSKILKLFYFFVCNLESEETSTLK